MIWQQTKRIPIQIVQKKQHKFLNMLYSGTQGIPAMPENDSLLEPAKAIWHQPTTAMAISKETERNYLENGFGYFCCHLAPASLAVPADQKRTKQRSPPGVILGEKELKDLTCLAKQDVQPSTPKWKEWSRNNCFQSKEQIASIAQGAAKGNCFGNNHFCFEAVLFPLSLSPDLMSPQTLFQVTNSSVGF